MKNPESDNLNKTIFIQSLPFSLSDFTVRKRTRADLDLRCAWPSYPTPYEVFNSSMIGKGTAEIDALFNQHNPDELALSVEHTDEKLVGSFTLREIKWKTMEINNMGIRIHPSWCDKGIGTMLLSGISEWCFSFGFTFIRFDVSKENQRAIRAYDKAGFKKISEISVGDNLHWLMERRKDV